MAASILLPISPTAAVRHPTSPIPVSIPPAPVRIIAPDDERGSYGDNVRAAITKAVTMESKATTLRRLSRSKASKNRTSGNSREK